MSAQKESRDALNEELLLCIKKNQWSEAVAILKKLMRLDPTNTLYLLRIGDYSAKIGAKKEAIAAYMSAGNAFSANGFLVKAIAAYKMILNLEPTHPEAKQRLQGLHAETRGRTDPKMILDIPAPAAAPIPDARPTEVPADAMTPPAEEIPFEVERTSLAEEGQPVASSESSHGQGPAPSEEIRAVEETVSPAAKNLHVNGVIPLFANLTPEEFAKVIEGTTARNYPPGAAIVREGDAGDSIYIIVKGRAKVVTQAGGQEIRLGLLNENDFFGEVAFLTGRTRTADVVAVFETELLELPGETVRELLVQYPHIKSVLESLYMKRMQITIDVMKSAKGAL